MRTKEERRTEIYARIHIYILSLPIDLGGSSVFPFPTSFENKKGLENRRDGVVYENSSVLEKIFNNIILVAQAAARHPLPWESLPLRQVRSLSADSSCVLGCVLPLRGGVSSGGGV